jgi:hypothetical protein
MRVVLRVKAKWVNKISGSEKAGVGGSIPSLATTIIQRLTAISVPPECLTGVQMESKLGFAPIESSSSAGTTGTKRVLGIVAKVKQTPK